MTKRIEPRFFLNTIDWTIEQYHNMVGAGVLTENDRVELLRGKIIPMSPIGRFHAACVNLVNEFFLLKFQKQYTYLPQNPVAMLDDSEPEPDFVIARRDDDGYTAGHPTAQDILLLIEVSDSTLDKDRHHKLPIYADNGVEEYWIINLVDRQLEIYTQPSEQGYAETAILQEKETLNHDRWGEIYLSAIFPGL